MHGDFKLYFLEISFTSFIPFHTAPYSGSECSNQPTSNRSAFISLGYY